MSSHFYNTIANLRSSEDIILYDKLISYTPEDEQLVEQFLQLEYLNECYNYPFTPPAYNGDAAVWAAKTLYNACQLIIHRNDKDEALQAFFTPYKHPIDASAILSADLCLRFLPIAAKDISNIDPDDALVPILQQIIDTWHYSSIGYKISDEPIAMQEISKSQCLLQLYADRVILRQDKQRATEPIINKKIRESFGDYAQLYWQDLQNN
jgi:hypothetical protein